MTIQFEPYSLSLIKKCKLGFPLIGLMESLFADSGLSGFDRVHLCFALAKVYEELGKYDKSFACLVAGNHLQKQEKNYNPDDDREFFLF